MKLRLKPLAFLLAGLLGASGSLLAAPTSASSPAVAAYAISDPARQIEDLARLFRASDVAGLTAAILPASKWEEARLTFELHQLEPISIEERAEFTEKLQRFVGDDAVEVLMAEFEPKLIEAQPKLPGALMMAMGSIHVALNSQDTRLSEEQRLALLAALPGLQLWATTTDFLNPATLRQALGLLTDAARATGITDLDQFRTLPLEAVLDRASPLLTAAKDAVRLYGIDLDEVADSLRVDVLEIDGERARVRTTVTLFNAPIWNEHELRLVEGRWYPKHAFRHFGHPHHPSGPKEGDTSHPEPSVERGPG